MREILFRGKRLDTGEWVEGDLVRHYENQRRFIACEQMAYTYTECGIDRLVSERYHEVEPASISQFTGLHDKNGKRIFEGDIFRTRLGVVAVVEWEKEGRFLGFTVGGERKIIYINREPAVEVIGTIHDKEVSP